MSAMASQIISLTIVYSTVYSDAIKENIKAPRHWPLGGEFDLSLFASQCKVEMLLLHRISVHNWWKKEFHIAEVLLEKFEKWNLTFCYDRQLSFKLNGFGIFSWY